MLEQNEQKLIKEMTLKPNHDIKKNAGINVLLGIIGIHMTIPKLFLRRKRSKAML